MQAVEICNVRHLTCVVGRCVLGSRGRYEGIPDHSQRQVSFPLFEAAGTVLYTVQRHTASPLKMGSLTLEIVLVEWIFNEIRYKFL